MSDILHFLQHRNSAPRLTAPAPSEAQLEEMLRCAIRAPDHAWLRPWRFLAIEGERREALGDLLDQCLQLRDPAATDAAREKARQSPLRAPLILIAIARLSEHTKVPHVEQRMSAACAAHGLLLSAEALGFAGVWRTGDAAYDRNLMEGLGLERSEEIVGFMYLGSRDGKAKPLPAINPLAYLENW